MIAKSGEVPRVRTGANAMTFLKTKSGMVNSEYVVTIRRTSDNGATLVLADGKFDTALVRFDELDEDFAQTIPNTTQMQAVVMDRDDDGVHFSPRLVPIIAWRLVHGRTDGLLPNGEVAEYLLYPDGRVEHESGDRFISLADAKRAFAAEHDLKPKVRDVTLA